MRFGKKNPPTVPSKEKREAAKPKTTRILGDYTLCIHCRKSFVKKVYKGYRYKPVCQDCRKAYRKTYQKSGGVIN